VTHVFKQILCDTEVIFHTQAQSFDGSHKNIINVELFKLLINAAQTHSRIIEIIGFVRFGWMQRPNIPKLLI
jgi:hypothetical protein